MAWTQEQLDALEEAMTSGVLTVQYKDKTVTYRSLPEMESLRTKIRRALGLSNKTKRTFANFAKGVDSSTTEEPEE